ncbi:MAG: hypothetical protein FWJ85_06360 [Solitalea sp.]
MRKPQDKEFDARLKAKMEGFTVNPPPAVWTRIEQELHGTMDSEKPAAWWRAAWLKVAAGICLLAAAGLWLYRAQRAVNEEDLVARIEKDTLVSAPEPGVTILNRSRNRSQPARESPKEPAKKSASKPDSAESPPTSTPAPVTEPAEGEQLARITQPAVRAVTAGKPDTAQALRIVPALEPVQVPVPVRPEPQQPVLALAAPPSPDEYSEMADAQGVEPQGRNALLPPELPEKIREVSGIGGAVNLAAAVVDRSRNKFLRIDKDEESGKWSGLRLDLGVIIISYQKPTEKNNNERN